MDSDVCPIAVLTTKNKKLSGAAILPKKIIFAQKNKSVVLESHKDSIGMTRLTLSARHANKNAEK